MRNSSQKPGTLGRAPSALLYWPALAVSAGLLVSLGCERNQVSHASVPQDAPPPAAPPMVGAHGAAPGAPAAMPPGSMPPGAMPPGAMPAGQVPMPPHPTGALALKWSLPKGWNETPGSGMRYATLTPPGPGKIEVSVVVLPGAAGGEMANVNRWRGQIGLPPQDDDVLAKSRKVVQSKIGPVAVYDFTSEGGVKSRKVTGLISTPQGSTWFFKMMGDAEPVGKAKPAFMKYLESLHLG